MSIHFFNNYNRTPEEQELIKLRQIVWLQLLCIALYPMFFNRINVYNDLANVIIYAAGLLVLSYLLLRNFAFNDEKYKTKVLFSILPVTPKKSLEQGG